MTIRLKETKWRSDNKEKMVGRRAENIIGQRNSDDASWNGLQLTVSDEQTVTKPLFGQPSAASFPFYDPSLLPHTHPASESEISCIEIR